MNEKCQGPFSGELQNKINLLKARRNSITLGSLHFASPLLLAPMSSIGVAPFRLLMEDLGAGGTVSELISCHGINYKNVRTTSMLKIDPKEKNVGLQLFGENKEAMALAAKVAEEFGPKFIDINMGCPVKKVVGTGAGSSLLKDTSTLGTFFHTIKSAIQIPLTIKIRTGWDQETINASEVIRIANEEGIEFVAIHGRTRAQQYTGKADWNLINSISTNSPLPIIGNGDLNSEKIIQEKINHSSCQAFMLGRGPLRNPFLFLTPYIKEDEPHLHFTPKDYFEVLNLLVNYSENYAHSSHIHLISIRKHIIWMAAGFQNVSTYRDQIYKTQSMDETLKLSKEFFYSQEFNQKNINADEDFMTSGHG